MKIKMPLLLITSVFLCATSCAVDNNMALNSDKSLLVKNQNLVKVSLDISSLDYFKDKNFSVKTVKLNNKFIRKLRFYAKTPAGFEATKESLYNPTSGYLIDLTGGNISETTISLTLPEADNVYFRLSGLDEAGREIVYLEETSTIKKQYPSQVQFNIDFNPFTTFCTRVFNALTVTVPYVDLQNYIKRISGFPENTSVRQLIFNKINPLYIDFDALVSKINTAGAIPSDTNGFTVETKGSVNVTVKDNLGNTISDNVTVLINSQISDEPVLSNGNFLVNNVNTGKWTVWATHDTSGAGKAEVTITTGALNTSIVITLSESSFKLPAPSPTPSGNFPYMTNTVVKTIQGNSKLKTMTDGSKPYAALGSIRGIIQNADGSYYFSTNSSLRKIMPDGFVTTLVGNPLSSGGIIDGNQSQAMFASAGTLIKDNLGSIWVADRSAIRKVAPDFSVSTFVGSNSSGYADGIGAIGKFYRIDDMVKDSNGNFFLVDNGCMIRKVTPLREVTTFAGANTSFAAVLDGKGTAARFNNINSIGIDSNDNLYVLELSLGIIRKVDPQGNVTTIFNKETLFGSASSKFNFLRVDKDNNLIISAEGKFHKFIIAENKMITIAGAGYTYFGSNVSVDDVGSNALMMTNKFILDSDGNILFADDYYGGGALRKVEFLPSGETPVMPNPLPDIAFDNMYNMPYAGTSSGTPVDGDLKTAKFYPMTALRFSPKGNLFVTQARAIRKISTTGVVTTLAGDISTNYSGGISVDGNSATASFSDIRSLAVDSNENLYVVDSNLIRKVTADGTVTTLFSQNINNHAITSNRTKICVDENDNLYVIYSGYTASNQVLAVDKVTPAGTVSKYFEKISPSGGMDVFDDPVTLKADSSGNLYTAGTDTIYKIDTNGNLSLIAGKRFSNSRVAVDGVNGLDARFVGIYDLTLDNLGNIYINDRGLIRKMTSNSFVEVIGVCEISSAIDVAPLNVNEVFFTSSFSNTSIRKIFQK